MRQEGNAISSISFTDMNRSFAINRYSCPIFTRFNSVCLNVTWDRRWELYASCFNKRELKKRMDCLMFSYQVITFIRGESLFFSADCRSNRTEKFYKVTEPSGSRKRKPNWHAYVKFLIKKTARYSRSYPKTSSFSWFTIKYSLYFRWL